MNAKIIPILSIALLATSCDTVYKMTTVIDRDGSAVREITGDMTADPVLYDYDDSWEATGSDTLKTITKKAASVENLSEGLRFEEYARPLAAPVESLKKRFGWFYTYYDFKAVYPEIANKGSVPIGSYIGAEEMALWFRGDVSPYAGMNGVELHSLLDDIDTDFGKWWGRSMYEIYFDIISGLAKNSPYSPLLPEAREKVFSDNAKNIEIFDFQVVDFCGMLDKHFSTGYFSALYTDNKEIIESEAEEKTIATKLFEIAEISYNLTMPGRVVSTNAPMRNDGALEWKVDAWRVLASDYTLTAESRVPNYWMWGLTLLMIIAAVCFFAAYRARS